MIRGAAPASSAASQHARDSSQRRSPISAWPFAASSRGSPGASCERLLVALQRGLVVPEVVLAEALVEQRAARRIVLERDRLAAARDRPLRIAAEARRLRGAGEQVDAVDAGVAVPELERALEVHARLGVGEHVARPRSRPRPTPRSASSRSPARWHWWARWAGVVERRGDRAVQRDALGRQQALVDHLADQPVAEGDAVALAHQHAGVERLAQRVRLDLQALPAARTTRARRPRPAPRARRRRAAAPARAPPRRRVSVRAANSSSTKNGFPPARACSSAGQRRRAPGRRRSPRAAAPRPRGASGSSSIRSTVRRRPSSLASRRSCRRELVVDAVGGEDDDPLGAQVAREEREQRERRAIGPVDVLEHEQHAALGASRRAGPAAARTAVPGRPSPGGSRGSTAASAPRASADSPSRCASSQSAGRSRSAATTGA